MGIFTKTEESSSDFERSSMQFTPVNEPKPIKQPARAIQTQPVQQSQLQKIPAKSNSSKPVISYGIQEAIKLMRELPDSDMQIVVTVVKKTLESTRIKISDIILDAKRKETEIITRTKKLENEIRDLQEKVTRRNTEIESLNDDLYETTRVKDNLILAEAEADRSQYKQTATDNITLSHSEEPDIKNSIIEAEIKNNVIEQSDLDSSKIQ